MSEFSTGHHQPTHNVVRYPDWKTVKPGVTFMQSKCQQFHSMNDHAEPLMKLIEMLPEPARAAVLAALIAFVRVVYDGKEHRWIRRSLESVLCGLIALGLSNLISALGMPDGWSTFIGASVGLFGADKVREWGQRFAEKKGL